MVYCEMTYDLIHLGNRILVHVSHTIGNIFFLSNNRIAYGAEYMGNRPRHVNFARPDALSLADVSLPDMTATPSDADLRVPEDFYEPLEINEPEGRLIEFNDSYRTYEMGDRSYVTVIGGYSGLYKDQDGKIFRVDDTLVSPETKKAMKRKVIRYRPSTKMQAVR